MAPNRVDGFSIRMAGFATRSDRLTDDDHCAVGMKGALLAH